MRRMGTGIARIKGPSAKTTTACFDAPARCHHGVNGYGNRAARGYGNRDASRRRARSRPVADLRTVPGQPTARRRTAPGRLSGPTAAG
ncbi:MAG: hypothetical protein ACRDOL_16585 [Streptosporangiaceae bacterium]